MLTLFILSTIYATTYFALSLFKDTNQSKYISSGTFSSNKGKTCIFLTWVFTNLNHQTDKT